MASQWLTALWNRGQSTRRQRRRPQRRRVERYFDCTWLSAWGEEKCRVSSLSPTGCYIDSRFTVPPAGTPVQDITVALPGGSITLQGTVISAMKGVGFAVRFTEIDGDARTRLNAIVQSCRERRSVSA